MRKLDLKYKKAIPNEETEKGLVQQTISQVMYEEYYWKLKKKKIKRKQHILICWTDI